MRHGPTIKVRCEYEDGQDWLEEYRQGHADAGMSFVEMRAEEWVAYQTHCVQCRLWSAKIREMSERQWEMDEAKKHGTNPDRPSS